MKIEVFGPGCARCAKTEEVIKTVLAELKRDGGKLTRAQVEWIELLRQCPGIEVYVWFPRDLAAIAVVLR